MTTRQKTPLVAYRITIKDEEDSRRYRTYVVVAEDIKDALLSIDLPAPGEFLAECHEMAKLHNTTEQARALRFSSKALATLKAGAI